MQRREHRFFSNSDLFKLFLPIVVEQFLEYSVGLINSIMAASVGEAAVSAVSLVEFVMALFISVFSAIATGGSVVAGRFLGAKQGGNAKNAINQLIWFSLIFSSAIMFAILLGRNFILDFMFGDVSADVRNAAKIYLVVSSLSVPFLAVYAAAAGAFRTMDNSKLPMYIMLNTNILNVILTAVAIYRFDLGILGIALSALATRILAAAAIVYLLLDRSRRLRLKKSLKFKFDPATIKRILDIAIPYGFENGLFYAGRLIVLSLIATLGTASIAANAVGGTIAMYQVLPGMAIGVGFSVIVSRCVGAGDFEQVKFYTKKIIALVYVSQFFSILATILLLEPILSLYSLLPEANEMTKQVVWWHGAAMLAIWPLAYTFPVVFRAAGDARYAMWVSVWCMFACRIALSYVFALQLGMGMIGTWFAMFADWGVKGVLFTVRYLNGKWMKFKIV